MITASKWMVPYKVPGRGVNSCGIFKIQESGSKFPDFNPMTDTMYLAIGQTEEPAEKRVTEIFKV